VEVEPAEAAGHSQPAAQAAIQLGLTAKPAVQTEHTMVAMAEI